MAKETVTITKEEYLRLLDRDLWLDCLEQAGVDDWVGLDFAQEIYQENLDEA